MPRGWRRRLGGSLALALTLAVETVCAFSALGGVSPDDVVEPHGVDAIASNALTLDPRKEVPAHVEGRPQQTPIAELAVLVRDTLADFEPPPVAEPARPPQRGFPGLPPEP